MSLAEVRKQIDELDDQIVALLARRQQLVKRASAYKQDEAAVRAPDRRKLMMERLASRAVEQGVDPDVVARVYTAMIQGNDAKLSGLIEGYGALPSDWPERWLSTGSITHLSSGTGSRPWTTPRHCPESPRTSVNYWRPEHHAAGEGLQPRSGSGSVAVSSSGRIEEVRPINACSGRVLSPHGRAVHPT